MYTQKIRLSTILCDQDDRLTIWGLARLFQDVAGFHSDTLGVGFEGLKPINKAWVLTRVYYRIVRYPMAGEELTLKTWARIDNGLIAPRDYELIDSNGNICATSSSQWVIIDMNSRHVCRLKDIVTVFNEYDISSTEKMTLEKILPPNDMICMKHIDVPYSAIDHTRHTNNAEYMKWIHDSVPALCKSTVDGKSDVSTFEINYLKETKYGDKQVRLFHKQQKQDNNTYDYFRIDNSEGTAVIARVHIIPYA